MAEREKQIRLFQRAAEQRLQAAEFLLENDFCLDATYLAGYAVECALKALVFQWTPRREFAETYEKLTHVGAKGHDYEYLKGLLKERKQGKSKTDHEVLGSLVKLLQVVGPWSTGLRYQAGNVDAEDAEEFVKAARSIHEQCLRS